MKKIVKIWLVMSFMAVCCLWSECIGIELALLANLAAAAAVSRRVCSDIWADKNENE